MADKANNLAQEISAYYLEANTVGNQWTFVERMLQLIDREKIMVLNRYRKNHGEPLLIPEPQRYKGIEQKEVGWVVDVPKPWVSLVGKDGKS